MRKALVAAVAACTFGLASGQALAVPCGSILSIGAWEAAGSCEQGDKIFTLNSTSLGDPVTVLFINPSSASHGIIITGFDTTDAPGTWGINYTITVTDPNFFISAMFAEADNPGGGSLLTKDVSGDETFLLTVVDGTPNAGSFRLGLDALELTIDEVFHANFGADLNTVSNTFRQSRRNVVPEPGTLALLGLGLVAAAAARRRRT